MKQNDAPKKQNPNSFSLLLYLYSTQWVGIKMLLRLYIRLVAMISLKLSVLPGLYLSSIQTLNCKRQLQYSFCFTVYCRERKTPKLWDPGDSGPVLERQRWKGISAEPYLPTPCGESLLIYSGHLSCNSPPTEFTELLKWRKGLPKPLQSLLLSSHGSELFHVSSYVLEKPKRWVQRHLDLSFDSDLSPFTDICFNL